MEKWELNSASSNIACNFLQNTHRTMLFVNPHSKKVSNMFVCIFYNLNNGRCIAGINIFLSNLFFSLYLVPWVVAVSNMCDLFLFLVLDGLPNVFSLTYELLINALYFFLKIHKIIIRLEEIFHRHICIHFSVRYEKSNKLDGPPGRYPCTIQTDLGFSTVIMTQYIVILHQPPVSVIICNNFRILELDYRPIHHPHLLYLTPPTQSTRKGWHHHNIVIRLLKKNKLNSVSYQSQLRYTTSQIYFDLKQSLMPYPLTLLRQ